MENIPLLHHLEAHGGAQGRKPLEHTHTVKMERHALIDASVHQDRRIVGQRERARHLANRRIYEVESRRIQAHSDQKE